MSVIATCSPCLPNPYQTGLYGISKRIHNLCGQAGSSGHKGASKKSSNGSSERTSGTAQARCTVCGTKREVKL